MLAFLQVLRDRYAGAAGYAKTHCGLTDADLRVIRENLVVRRDPPDLDSWREKVSRLERELTDAIAAAQAAPAKK